MTDYETREAFYSQFEETGMQGHRDFCASAEGTIAILRDPWKAQPPKMRITPPGDWNDAASILAMIRKRQADKIALDNMKENENETTT
jgi:hypothetical protein